MTGYRKIKNICFPKILFFSKHQIYIICIQCFEENFTMMKFVTKCAIFSFAVSCISFSQDSSVEHQNNPNQPQVSQQKSSAQQQIPEDQKALATGLLTLKTQMELIKGNNNFCCEDRWEKIGKSILKVGAMALPLTLAIKLIDKIIPSQNSTIGSCISSIPFFDPGAMLSSAFARNSSAILLDNFILNRPEFYSALALAFGCCCNVKHVSILKYIANATFSSIVLPYFNACWAEPCLEKLSKKCSFIHNGIAWLSDKAMNSFDLSELPAHLYNLGFNCNVQVINGLRLQATEALENVKNDQKANKKIENFMQESSKIIQGQASDISFKTKCLIALNTLENFGFVGYSIISLLTSWSSSSDELD